jgi:hypothetical protein
VAHSGTMMLSGINTFKPHICLEGKFISLSSSPKEKSQVPEVTQLGNDRSGIQTQEILSLKLEKMDELKASLSSCTWIQDTSTSEGGGGSQGNRCGLQQAVSDTGCV